MRIRVIGAGALGMLLASKLTKAGAAVELVTRTGEQAKGLREQGLLITEESNPNNNKEEFETAGIVTPSVLTFEEAAASSHSGEEQERLPDVMVLAVKQTSISEAMAVAIQDQLRKPGSRLVCFQNGIGHIELLRRHIPHNRLHTAVTTEGALKRSPRHVAHTGRGMTWIEEHSHSTSPVTDHGEMSIKIFQKMMAHAGFNVSLSNNITSKVWNKLLINAVINPVTAILQVRNGQLLELPASLTLMRSLFDEGVRLADKLNIELSSDLWEQLLNVCQLTANNRSSMLQDVMARRPSEIFAITGGLLAAAREAGMELPAHYTMFQLLRSIEQQWETI